MVTVVFMRTERFSQIMGKICKIFGKMENHPQKLSTLDTFVQGNDPLYGVDSRLN